MEYKECNIKGFEGLYYIYENGDIYSVRKRRMLKQTLNGYDQYAYKYVCFTGLNGEYWRGPAHIMIALHWIGPKPSKLHEINHKDKDKLNNYYTNLEWITHQQNMVHAREVKNWVSGRNPGFTHSDKTKAKMSLKKHKKVFLFTDTQEIVKESVQDVLLYLNIPRRQFNRYVGTNRTIKGFKIRIL